MVLAAVTTKAIRYLLTDKHIGDNIKVASRVPVRTLPLSFPRLYRCDCSGSNTPVWVWVVVGTVIVAVEVIHDSRLGWMLFLAIPAAVPSDLAPFAYAEFDVTPWRLDLTTISSAGTESEQVTPRIVPLLLAAVPCCSRRPKLRIATSTCRSLYAVMKNPCVRKHRASAAGSFDGAILPTAAMPERSAFTALLL
jgi:hypothetical protein